MFAGAFIFIMAVALWFLRFALSTGWLSAIATFGLPLYNAVSAYVNQMMLGRHSDNHLRHRRRLPRAARASRSRVGDGRHRDRSDGAAGHGVLPTRSRDLYSEHGLLALGRGTGLEIAQAAIGAPFASGASLDAKLDALMSHVVTAGVRHPLQVLNFGMVVDDIGGCRQAWSSAMMAAQGVDGAGPAHAMANCGAPQALAYAQRLGGCDAALASGAGAGGHRGRILLLVCRAVRSCS